MKISAVIPAFNEEDRILNVLSVLKECSFLEQIIVVSDGSSDNTAEVAASIDGITVIALSENHGKGGAMFEGVSRSESDAIIFLDADLIGLKPDHVESIARPVLNGEVGMCIGVFKAGRRSTDWAQVIAPFISGQRAVLRKNFLSMSDPGNSRYGIEVSMTRYARDNGIPFKTVPLAGVTHLMKEEKLGFIKGAMARTVMYWEIMKIFFGFIPHRKKIPVIRKN